MSLKILKNVIKTKATAITPKSFGGSNLDKTAVTPREISMPEYLAIAVYTNPLFKSALKLGSATYPKILCVIDCRRSQLLVSIKIRLLFIISSALRGVCKVSSVMFSREKIIIPLFL